MRMSADKVVVGRIGRAQGLRGEVRLEVRTDEPEVRFAPGSVLVTDAGRELTVARLRTQGNSWVVAFDGVTDRTAAEQLSGTLLYADALTDVPDEPDTFYDHQLVGLRVRDADGAALGKVAEVVHLPGHDLLAVDYVDREVLVPFVREITVEVDLEAGVVVVDPPSGLFDDGEA